MLFSFWKSHLSALLIHPTEAKVLLLAQEKTWSLPNTIVKGKVDRNNFQQVKQLFESELGIKLSVLQYACDHEDTKQKHIFTTYVIEQQDHREQVTKGTWIDTHNLNKLTFAEPTLKKLLDQYLKEFISGNIPELRPPWALPGWFSEVSAWIENQLSSLGYQQIAPIEYVKNWSISCVLKVPTDAGNFYLKEASTLPLFCDEPVITAELAKLFPQNMPKVIGYQDSWLLLEDFGEPIGSKRPPKVRQHVYQLLATMQIASIEHCDRLLQLGCLDRRLEILSKQIELLANDENATSGLSAPEKDRFQSLVTTLQDYCTQLGSYKIPSTLVHGDLHLGNVTFNQGNYLFFDWTDACISHPFFDFLEFFIANKSKSWLINLYHFQSDRSKARLRDYYLSQWQEYESLERLQAAWSLAGVLCLAHHAVTYQHIIATLEPRTKSEFENFLPFLLRQILANFAN